MTKPSVTELLDLLAKPGLVTWANKLGLQGIDVNQRRKADKSAGSSIHEQIETGVFERECDAQSFAAFMRGKTLLSAEQSIETEWFVGRYDAHLRVGEDEYIADYKNGFRGRVYLEHRLQLIAYTMAKPAKMAVVSAPEFRLYPLHVADRRPYERMLVYLSRLWHLKREVKHDI